MLRSFNKTLSKCAFAKDSVYIKYRVIVSFTALVNLGVEDVKPLSLMQKAATSY